MKYFPLILSLILAPQLTFSATMITNTVSAEANSGGNSAGSGEVIVGQTQAEVRVYTEINGEVMEDFHEVKTGSAGESVKVELESVNVVGSSEVKTEINTSSESAKAVETVESVVTTDESALAMLDNGEVESKSASNKIWSFVKYVFSFFYLF